MLKKENRLQKDLDFKKVFKKSKPVYSGKLVIRLAQNNLQSQTRFGFVISNKIDKRATRRNELKRKLRNIALELIPRISAVYDIIILVKENYPYPYDYKYIREDFFAGLEKLRILDEKVSR